MQKLKPFFIVLLLSTASQLMAQPVQQNKFSIKLPDAWKSDPRFLEKLSLIIKEHIPQLEKKDECFGCNAAYTVSFHITPATVTYVYPHPTASYQFTTYYNFFSYMDVSDATGSLVHRLILNDSLADHAINKKLYGRGTYKPPVQNTSVKGGISQRPATDDQETDVTVLHRAKRQSALITPFDTEDFIRKNLKQLTPTAQDLWNKVEEILRDYKLEGESEPAAQLP